MPEELRREALITVTECAKRGLYEEARGILHTLDLPHKANELPERNEPTGLTFGYW